MPGNPPVTHLTAGQVTAYLDVALDAAERASIEAHVAECAECRAELVEVARLLRANSRRRWIVGVPLAAAAAVLLLVLGPLRPTPAGGPDRERAGGRDTGPQVLLIAPVDRAASVNGALTWHGAAPEAQYRVTVTDARGDVVWTGATADTSVVVPTTRLRSGQRYFWYVDVLFSDGHSVASAVWEFRTAP